MIELRTLGGLELHGADGRELRPVLQQPKRLALLVFLAIGGSRGFHRRDSLLALFWPEHDADRARAALRRSLHFLRQSLGRDVIVGRGDEDVGVAPDALTTDVARFDAAIADGRLADAMELFRGDLLQGVYIRGAPAFEHWLDAERDRLRQRATTTAWTLATQCVQSEPSLAAQWARRAAALTPHDEAAHRRLLGILHGIGDRAAALRAHDEFAARLRADYEVNPAAETLAIVRQIRQDPGIRVDHARPAAPAETAGTSNGSRQDPSTRVIAVLPFTVRGNRDLSYLGEGMVDLLSTTLDAAGDLRSVDPRAILGHLQREAERDPTPQTANGTATTFNADLFLLGSIVEAGGRIRIVASLYETGTVALRASADVSGSGEAGIFDMVDEIARILLARDSDRPHGRLKRLGAMTTVVLPALKAYLRGECEFRAGRYFQALEHFQNAAAEDTGFALAYYRLSASAAAVANLPLAREAIAQALVHRGKLAEHDRLLLEAQDAWLRGAADEAESLYRTVVATHVDDLEAWFLLGDVLFHHNPLRGRPISESREAFERALRFDPDHVSALVHLARLAALERAEELDQLVDRILALSPAGDRAVSARALRAFTLGRTLEKASVVTALGRARALAVGIAFTDIIVYARDVEAARGLAELFTRLSRGGEERLLCHITLAHLALASGDVPRALQQLAEAEPLGIAWPLECRGLFAVLPFHEVADDELRLVRDRLERWDAATTPPARNAVLSVHNDIHPLVRLYLLGLLNARLGDQSAAEQSVAALRRLPSTDRVPRGFADAMARSVRAQVERLRGRLADALTLLEGISTDIWYQSSFLSPFYSLAFERFARAELLADVGRGTEAARWLDGLGQSSPFELIYLDAARRLRQRL